MTQIYLKCPECEKQYSMKFDYIPEGGAIINKCPFCRRETSLTPDDVVDEPAVEKVHFNSAKRASLKKNYF